MTHLKWYNHPAYYAWNRMRSESEGSNEYIPSTNVIENDDAYKLEIAAPGYTKKDFNINLEKNVLTISSTRALDEEVKYSRKEFAVGGFSRSFNVPETIETDKIKAEYKNGVLSLSLPKKEEVKISKEIKVI